MSPTSALVFRASTSVVSLWLLSCIASSTVHAQKAPPLGVSAADANIPASPPPPSTDAPELVCAEMPSTLDAFDRLPPLAPDASRELRSVFRRMQTALASRPPAPTQGSLEGVTRWATTSFRRWLQGWKSQHERIESEGAALPESEQPVVAAGLGVLEARVARELARFAEPDMLPREIREDAELYEIYVGALREQRRVMAMLALRNFQACTGLAAGLRDVSVHAFCCAATAAVTPLADTSDSQVSIPATATVAPPRPAPAPAAPAGASLSPGQRISVLWNGTWYDATVLRNRGSLVRIHYDGWGSEWDEDVTLDRIRPRGGGGRSGSASPRDGSYAPGQRVSVLWNGTWYDATVLRNRGRLVRIHYDGWGSEWDEDVTLNRIRDR